MEKNYQTPESKIIELKMKTTLLSFSDPTPADPNQPERE